MEIDKSLLSGSTTMLVLNLLSQQDMYGYEMIETIGKISKEIFSFKAGTLYPLLHNLEEQGMIQSYEKNADHTRVRKYYTITPSGRKLLEEKKSEWTLFVKTMSGILEGGIEYAMQ